MSSPMLNRDLLSSVPLKTAAMAAQRQNRGSWRMSGPERVTASMPGPKVTCPMESLLPSVGVGTDLSLALSVSNVPPLTQGSTAECDDLVTSHLTHDSQPFQL